MNISVKDKKMSYKVFAATFGKHFAYLPEAKREDEIRLHFEKATGRKAPKKKA